MAANSQRDTLPAREERCITAKSVARAARRLVRMRCLAEAAAACTAVSCSTCPITRHIKSPPAVPTWSELQRQYLYFCTSKASTFETVKQDLDAFFAGKQCGAHIKGRELHRVPLRLLCLLHVSHSVYVVNRPRIEHPSSIIKRPQYVAGRARSLTRIAGRAHSLTSISLCLYPPMHAHSPALQVVHTHYTLLNRACFTHRYLRIEG